MVLCVGTMLVLSALPFALLAHPVHFGPHYLYAYCVRERRGGAVYPAGYQVRGDRGKFHRQLILRIPLNTERDLACVAALSVES